MNSYSIFKGIVFLFLALAGIPSNLAISVSYAIAIHSGKKIFPTDKIISLISIVNTIMLLTRGIPDTLFIFGVKDLFNSTGCKTIIYLSRLSRAMAIGLTCVLSCLQFATINPPSSKWAAWNARASKYLMSIVLAILVLNLLLCISSVVYSLPGSQYVNLTHNQFIFNLGYCKVFFPTKVEYHGHGLMLLARDVIFVVLMILASTAIIHLLYRHQKQMKKIHSSSSQATMPEMKAAKAVVTLVTLYAIFFGVENTIFLYTMLGNDVNVYLSDVRFLFSILYATVFPFIIIGTNYNVRKHLKCFTRENEADSRSDKDQTATSVSHDLPHLP
ncbi:olfactory receptor class A-like protein 1 [Microcaecilia unicolor]|uniref:Vomeronasal type-1 receptor n=1 Tax=Microcaecilia unicolor TaxID=1415580 RepID=A0A6P7YPV6_9AMPH|nr:olfactory receptor class A-like protein 1 [Microcaecilia unicolor]